jgi:hypothetical protein
MAVKAVTAGKLAGVRLSKNHASREAYLCHRGTSGAPSPSQAHDDDLKARSTANAVQLLLPRAEFAGVGSSDVC